MKGAIWYSKDRQKAEKQVSNIIESYARADIKVSRMVQANDFIYTDVVCFENGDSWIVLNSSFHNGQRFNVSYVCQDIDTLFYEIVIKSSTTAPPFQAFYFYD